MTGKNPVMMCRGMRKTNMLEKNFNPQEAETRIYKIWEQSGAFKPRMDPALEPYCIVIPPPNVTGALHMGHAVNNTIQDILIRFNRMRGKDVLWQPGTDHAGIATQMVVERKLVAAGGPGRAQMSREKFIGKVWEWKQESGDAITQQLRRLGSSCDWSREKFTLGDPPGDTQMADAITRAFVDLYNDGLIYRDKRLVNWDPHFQTAVSDLEVENREVDGHFWHFKYPLEDGDTYTYVEKDEDGNELLTEERDYISIATTRPETMLGDGAVAVHPQDTRYTPIVGKKVRLPLANRLIPIITDEYPDPAFGSGAVKITGAHDFNDHEVARRHDIPMYPLMGSKGEMIASGIMPETYVGLDRFEARKRIVTDIDAEGLLIRVEDKKIMQPFGDRSNVVIEPRLTDQWFLDAEKLAGRAIKAVDDGRTKFFPANWKKTYDIWMKDIQPWCLSRQLWWGHRIPAWYGPKCDRDGKLVVGGVCSDDIEIFVASTELEALALAKKRYNSESVGVASSLAEAVGMRARYPGVSANVGGEEISDSKFAFHIYRAPDVLDTWFSSGLWPFSTLGWPEETKYLERFYPGSVLVTAFDIIFFWVARMMMQGIHFRDEVPFRDVYIHALVLDEQGRKMSKSEGNVIDPIDLIQGIDIDALVKKRTMGLRQPEKALLVGRQTRKQYPDGFEAYGADALRFTLASMAGMGRNIKLSVDRVAGYRNFGTKLWNAARFVGMNGCQPAQDFNPSGCNVTVNQWIVDAASETTRKVTQYIDAYRFNDAANAIYKFARGTYCDWYLELIKPVLSGADGAEKTETQAAAAWGLDTILKLLHPFMPFITEELWAKTAGTRDDLLIVSRWPEPVKTSQNTTAEIDKLVRIITEIRSVRAEMNVPPSRKAPLIITEAAREFYETYAGSLEQMARVSELRFAEKIPEGSLQAVVGGVTLGIPLAGLIDLDAERKRLAGEIEKISAGINTIDKKLANKNFVEKAPEAVVARQKSRREMLSRELDTLTSALAKLGPFFG